MCLRNDSFERMEKMKKDKLTCKDVGMLATDDQRCIKNTDAERFVKEALE